VYELRHALDKAVAEFENPCRVCWAFEAKSSNSHRISSIFSIVISGSLNLFAIFSE